MANRKESSKGGNKSKSSRDKQSQDRGGSASHSSSSSGSHRSRREQGGSGGSSGDSNQQYDLASTVAEQGSLGFGEYSPRDAAQGHHREERAHYAQNHNGVAYRQPPNRQEIISGQINDFNRQWGSTHDEHTYVYGESLNFEEDDTGGDGQANYSYQYQQDPRRSS